MILYIIFVVLIWLLISRWQRRHIIKLSKELKTPYVSLPLIGQAYLTIGSEGIMKKIQDIGKYAIEYGGLTYYWLGHRFFIIAADPDVLDVISKKCLEKHYVMSFLSLIVGNGSLVAPASIWRLRRKTIVPTFHQQSLNHFVNRIFSIQSKIMVEKLHAVDNNKNFSIWDFINAYSFDSAFESITGVQLNVQSNPNHPFLKAFDKCCKLSMSRIFQPWLHNSAVYKLFPVYKTLKKNCAILNDFIDKIIQSKRKEIEIHKQNGLKLNSNGVEGSNSVLCNNRVKSILEHLLQQSDSQLSLTDVEYREELLVLTLAASDTSAVGTAFTAVMLSRHPDIQAKAYKELVEVFGESDRPVEASDISRLKYLEAVIKETLRLYPPVPLVIRNVEEDVLLPSGMKLVKGVGACLHIWAVHRNPKYWGEDAEQFRPERFLDTPLKHPAAFMPFSFGPRNCVGYRYAMMSMVTLLATILRSYQLVPATSADGHSNDKPLRLKYKIMMKDVEGYKMQKKPRF